MSPEATRADLADSVAVPILSFVAVDPYRFRDIAFRDRLRVTRAVAAGTAVTPPRLAPYAVSRARRYQVVPERGSLTWLMGFAEVGRLGLLPVFLVLGLVSDRWGFLAAIPAVLVTLVLLAPLSRRTAAARRRRAREAEIANAKLFDGSSAP
jgi:hypothetical protein